MMQTVTIHSCPGACLCGSPSVRKSQIKIHPATLHGFNAGYRASFRREQADDGRKILPAWFKANGVG